MVPLAVGGILTGGAVLLAAWPVEVLVRVVTLSAAAVLLFIGGVFDYIAYYRWLVRTEIRVRRGSLTVAKASPLWRWQTTYEAGDVSMVAAGVEGQSNVNGETTLFYGISVVTCDGKKAWLAADIFDKDYSDWLAAEIRKALGPPGG